MWFDLSLSKSMFDDEGKKMEEKVEAREGDNDKLRMLAAAAFGACKENVDKSEQASLSDSLAFEGINVDDDYASQQSALDHLEPDLSAFDPLLPELRQEHPDSSTMHASGLYCPLPATGPVQEHDYSPLWNDYCDYIFDTPNGQEGDTVILPTMPPLSQPCNDNDSGANDTRDSYDGNNMYADPMLLSFGESKGAAGPTVYKKRKPRKASGNKMTPQPRSPKKPCDKHRTISKPGAGVASSTTPSVITGETEDPSEPLSHDFSSLPTSSSDTDEYDGEGGYGATSSPVKTKSPVTKKKPKLSKPPIKKKKQQPKTAISDAKTVRKSKNRMNGRNLFASLLIKNYKLSFNEEEALASTKGTSYECMKGRALLLLRETPEEKKARAAAESGDRVKKPLINMSKLYSDAWIALPVKEKKTWGKAMRTAKNRVEEEEASEDEVIEYP